MRYADLEAGGRHAGCCTNFLPLATKTPPPVSAICSSACRRSIVKCHGTGSGSLRRRWNAADLRAVGLAVAEVDVDDHLLADADAGRQFKVDAPRRRPDDGERQRLRQAETSGGVHRRQPQVGRRDARPRHRHVQLAPRVLAAVADIVVIEKVQLVEIFFDRERLIRFNHYRFFSGIDLELTKEMMKLDEYN